MKNGKTVDENLLALISKIGEKNSRQNFELLRFYKIVTENT